MASPLYFCGFISFIVTLVATYKWIGKASELNIIGFDMNKPDMPKVPEMGGICVIFGFLLGVLFYVGLETFYSNTPVPASIFATLCTVLMVSIIGIMDDILGWKKGLMQQYKLFFTLFAAMPMMVINAGHTTMSLPIYGIIDWGILYPLLLVPIGIIGASNSFNMVAGFNGLEAGMGIIILSTLCYIAFITDEPCIMALTLCMVMSLAAFLYFNWYPAKVFPGDTMTYSVGALAACAAILGNMEKIAVLLFIPYAFDFFFQLRGRFKVEAFGVVNDDGSLEKPYKEIYHLTHLAIALLRMMKQRVAEKDVVIFAYGIELFVAALILRAFA